MTNPILVSAVPIQAVTASDLRAYLRGDDGEDDTNLNFYIQSATAYLEKVAHISITRKRYAIEFDDYDKLSVELPLGHVHAVITIEADGLMQNIENYPLRGDMLILPTYHHSLKINYDVGYDNIDQIPSDYKIAILAGAADLFVHRFSNPDPMPSSHKMLCYYGGLFKKYHL